MVSKMCDFGIKRVSAKVTRGLNKFGWVFANPFQFKASSASNLQLILKKIIKYNYPFFLCFCLRSSPAFN